MSLERLRKLLDTASRPPWWVNDGLTIAVCGQDRDGVHHEVGTPYPTGGEPSDDAALIAELRNHAEALLDVVDAAPRNLACHALPEKVALPPDVEDCGECEACRFNAALARLDGTEGS